MANGVNKVILIGNLGSDPEVRYTQGGQAVANFRLATGEAWVDKQGQKQERTEWHRIVAWGKLAELCKEYLSKGRQIYVEGRLQTRQWQDRDGNKRYTTEIQARDVRFLGGRGEASAGRKGEQPATAGEGEPTAEAGYDYGPPPMNEDDVPF